jgi:hypothetical protein
VLALTDQLKGRFDPHGAVMRRLLATCGLIGVCSAIGAGTAVAAPAPLTVDDREPALKSQDDGGWTVDLGLTNLTDGDIALAARPMNADDGCAPKVDGTLPQAQHSDVIVRVPPGCKVSEDGIDLQLVATSADSEAVIFDVTAAPKPDSVAPDWKQLRVFVVLFPVSLAGLFFLAWLSLADRPNLFEGLPHLESAWSFQDSWASNVTVAGGLLTGILGSSDLLKEVLGEDAEFSLAVATVGAAIAVAIAGAGALVALATRRKSDDGTRDLFTPYGLLIAGALTLAAAGGELWVVWKSGENLDMGGVEDDLYLAALVAGALLALYGILSLKATLRVGMTASPDPPVPPDPPGDAIVSAMLLLEAINLEGVDRSVIDRFAARYPTIVPPRAPLRTEATVTDEIPPVVVRQSTPSGRRAAML